MPSPIPTISALTSQRLKAIIKEVDDKESDLELFSRGQLVDVSGVPALPNVEELSKAELKKKPLDKWLYCCFGCRLNILWYEDVLKNLCNDLIGCLGILG